MKIIFILLLLSLLSGCITFPQKKDHLIYRDKPHEPKQLPVIDIPTGRIDKNLTHVEHFALLSANVYETYETSNSCVDDGKRFNLQQWSMIMPNDLPNFPVTPEWNIKVGVVGYEVWVNDNDKIISIVFRGTDFNEYEDWAANLRWITRPIPLLWDQYEQVEDLISPLLDYIQNRWGNEYKVITTGHSLGGGLAQQAAYADKRVDQVIAFDPSIVTGFYSIPAPIRNESKQGLTIYRVYEHGEILAYLRLLMKGVFPVALDNPDIIEVRYDLEQSNNPISQHNMKVMACKLYDISINSSNYQVP